MSAIIGTNVGAPIVPTDTADTYPTHEAQYGKGGAMAAANSTARLAIPSSRREIGMIVNQADTGVLYTLSGGITNSDWISLSGFTGAQGTQGVTGLSGSTGVQGVTGVGPQGTTGAAGASGTQGTTGVVGIHAVTVNRIPYAATSSTFGDSPLFMTGSMLWDANQTHFQNGVYFDALSAGGMMKANPSTGYAAIASTETDYALPFTPTGLAVNYLGSYYGVAANGPTGIVGLPGVWYTNGKDMTTSGGIESETSIHVAKSLTRGTIASPASASASLYWGVAGGQLSTDEYAVYINNGGTSSHGLRTKVNDSSCFALDVIGRANFNQDTTVAGVLRLTNDATLIKVPDWLVGESSRNLQIVDTYNTYPLTAKFGSDSTMFRLFKSDGYYNHYFTVDFSYGLTTDLPVKTVEKITSTSYVYASDLRQSGDNQTYKSITLANTLTSADATIAGWTGTDCTTNVRLWQIGHTVHYCYKIMGTGAGTSGVTIQLNGLRAMDDEYSMYLHRNYAKNSGTAGVGTCEMVNSGSAPAITLQFYPGSTIGQSWTDAVTRDVRGQGFFELYSGLSLFSNS